jgi:glycosyltransferase involved in cell wall biosynthesis
MTVMVPGLVSVIMPVYNARKYLAEAADSVVTQTYSAWELLLVDDGSTDGSTDLARQYAQRDPKRVRFLTHPDRRNRGASAARNLGLAHARGEFIAFLDADDVWLPEKLTEQVALLRATPQADVLYGRTLLWYSWTGRPEDAGRDRAPRLRVPTERPILAPRLLAACVAGRAAVPCTCSVLMRRPAVDAAGGFEEKFQRVYTDQVFYSKLLLHAPALAVDVCWDKYRQHPESSSAGSERAREGRVRRQLYLEWLAAYVHERGNTDPVLRRAIQRELWRCRHPMADALLDRLEYVRRRLGDTGASLTSRRRA